MATEVPFVFDMDLMRPACPILQAAHGGTPSASGLFCTSLWLTQSTPGMKTWMIDRDELQRVARRLNKVMVKR